MTALPPPFARWFAARGWTPRPHQLVLLEAARQGRSALLIAPTGGGKTLAGFLPSLLALHERPREGLHTLYVSPLKALAVDIARNLTAPVREIGLDIRIETRTGDTPPNRRARQRERPPHILLTTPESLLLLLSLPEAAGLFAGLEAVVVDEAHALAGTKRGDQLALGLSRLSRLAPAARRIGLSATVAHPEALRAWLAPGARAGEVALIRGEAGAAPVIGVQLPAGRLPWGGHMGLASAPEIMAAIAAARVSIVFVNTRAQAELMFAALWRLNEQALPIALHHGSLTVEQRRKVEAAMAEGRLRAVVATSSLDLGIDWGDVDQVIQVGAPKGVSRLLQRVGRANHRMEEASRALLVPANRFEVIECAAALESIAAGELDGEPPRPGGLDVLAQHILAMACHAPFHPDELYAEVTRAAPYAALSRRDFDDVLRFVEDGGYALRGYERFRRLFRDAEGRVHVRGPAVARQFRLNLGTIVEAPLVKVKLRGGPVLGEVEEWFLSTLRPGDAFLFAGQVLRFERIAGAAAEVSRGGEGDPRVPAYAGSRMPLSTHLAGRVRAILADPRRWRALPGSVRDWLRLQARTSALPRADGLLVESFPRGGRWFLVAYGFEGRLAHHSLGMLATKRMERLGWGPLGYVASDYALVVWSAFEPGDVAALFAEDLLGEELEEWIAESSVLRRSFRHIATIAGLIEKHHPGAEKSSRQMSVNADLIYEVLRRHEPDHVLLRATRAEAARGLTDVGRVGALLARAKGRITHRRLDHASPLAVPVLIEEGREWVAGGAQEALLAEAAALVEEATGGREAFEETPPPAGEEGFAPRPERPRAARRGRFTRSAPRALRR
ncbi:ligase-associated DNA damage response DEXH box helicase [Rubritepida flocculans]|uniref:ligase-associated DNA damage response DEXH box helicase n=1 Tax=Rubritepida flocculans TaxID=182403 RepID=UPI0004169E83|nr:ligase-associated DNA damage response DEXH box helicase [Rubritepida flocculans]